MKCTTCQTPMIKSQADVDYTRLASLRGKAVTLIDVTTYQMELEQRIAETRAETAPIERQVIAEHPTWNEAQVVAETTRRWLWGKIRRQITAARPSWSSEQIDAEVSRIMREGVGRQ